MRTKIKQTKFKQKYNIVRQTSILVLCNLHIFKIKFSTDFKIAIRLLKRDFLFKTLMFFQYSEHFIYRSALLVQDKVLKNTKTF